MLAVDHPFGESILVRVSRSATAWRYLSQHSCTMNELLAMHRTSLGAIIQRLIRLTWIAYVF